MFVINLKIMKKRWVLGLLVLAVISCVDGVEPPSYNPEEQLEIDFENIDNFLSENGITPNIDETGIRYVITREGVGEVFPEEGDSVTVSYSLYNFEGELLDTSIESLARDEDIFDSDRDYGPLEFVLGTPTLIFGFQRSTLLLKEDGAGDFYIPSVYAYQNRGTQNIAPNESILFKIELLSLRKQD